MSREQEEAVLDRGIELIEARSGRRPTGYVAPWWEFSPVTAELLLDRGIRYDHSLMHRDVTPYYVRVGDTWTPIDYERAPWEDAVDPPGPAARRGRAAALARLLAPWRRRVEPWGTGFAVRGPVGLLPPADGVDDVVARAAAARPAAAATLLDGPAEPLAGAAEAVVRASLVAWVTGGAVIRGPGLGAGRRILAHRDRRVELVPDAGGWRVAARAAQ